MALSPIILPLGLYLYDRYRKAELGSEGNKLNWEISAFKEYIDNHHVALIQELENRLGQWDQQLRQVPPVDLFAVGTQDYAARPGPVGQEVTRRLLANLTANQSLIQKREQRINAIQIQINYLTSAIRELRDLAPPPAAAAR